jgi:anti-sigma factor RsiW
LKELFDPVAAEPIPERLRRRRWRLPHYLVNLAASVLLVVAGGWMGWQANESELLPGSAASYVIEEAATSFRVFTPDRVRPVEVAAESRRELLSWLSDRLGAEVSAPALASLGFSLLGGRLIPTDAGIGALFMYEAGEGQRIVLYMCPTQAGGQTTPIKVAKEDEVTVFYWFDGPFSYAVAGDLEPPALEALARAAYRETSR